MLGERSSITHSVKRVEQYCHFCVTTISLCMTPPQMCLCSLFSTCACSAWQDICLPGAGKEFKGKLLSSQLWSPPLSILLGCHTRWQLAFSNLKRIIYSFCALGVEPDRPQEAGDVKASEDSHLLSSSPLLSRWSPVQESSKTPLMPGEHVG